MGDRRRQAVVGRGDRPALGESAAAETLRRFDDQAVDALPQRADKGGERSAVPGSETPEGHRQITARGECAKAPLKKIQVVGWLGSPRRNGHSATSLRR